MTCMVRSRSASWIYVIVNMRRHTCFASNSSVDSVLKLDVDVN